MWLGFAMPLVEVVMNQQTLWRKGPQNYQRHISKYCINTRIEAARLPSNIHSVAQKYKLV